MHPNFESFSISHQFFEYLDSHSDRFFACKDGLSFQMRSFLGVSIDMGETDFVLLFFAKCKPRSLNYDLLADTACGIEPRMNDKSSHEY